MMSAPRRDEADGIPSCSICLGDFTCPVGTNCGHSFCARCILTHWQHDRWPNACRCPVCRRDVTLLMGGDTWNSSQNRATYNEVTDYNHCVSTNSSPGFFARLRDIPAVIQYLYRDMFRLGGFPICSRMYIVVVLLLALLYLFSPIDIIPEGIFGIFGLADDVFAVLMAVIVIVNQYREYIVNIGDQMR